MRRQIMSITTATATKMDREVVSMVHNGCRPSSSSTAMSTRSQTLCTPLVVHLKADNGPDTTAALTKMAIPAAVNVSGSRSCRPWEIRTNPKMYSTIWWSQKGRCTRVPTVSVTTPNYRAGLILLPKNAKSPGRSRGPQTQLNKR